MEGKISYYWIQQGSAGCWMVIIVVGHDLLMSSRGPYWLWFFVRRWNRLQNGISKWCGLQSWCVTNYPAAVRVYPRRWFTGVCCRTIQIITIFIFFVPICIKQGGWGPSPPLRWSDVADSYEVFTSRTAEYSKCANAMKTILIPRVKVIGIAFALCIDL